MPGQRPPVAVGENEEKLGSAGPGRAGGDGGGEPRQPVAAEGGGELEGDALGLAPSIGLKNAPGDNARRRPEKGESEERDAEIEGPGAKGGGRNGPARPSQAPHRRRAPPAPPAPLPDAGADVGAGPSSARR